MEIFAKITGIKYQPTLINELKKIEFENFNINIAPSSSIIIDNKKLIGISKWISPKRTRSYPYKRIYETLGLPKKITVIPVVKDEGVEGDRDFIQWDTIALMSLLDVYVIPAYYISAERHRTRKNKITNQKFDNNYVLRKIQEIECYHSSALHWNIKELNENLANLIEYSKDSYLKIAHQLKVQLHNLKKLDNLKYKIQNDINEFMEDSRFKAQNAQNREYKTNQPKEYLSTLTKSQITISNYLGGKYYLTVDEVRIKDNTISLIESKYSKSSLLPSISDIKDGFIKMMLFTNLKEVNVNSYRLLSYPILQLTSSKLKSSISSNFIPSDLDNFITINNLSERNIQIIKKLFLEAKENNFIIIIKKG